MALYIYILECVNSTYYIGYTTDIARRYDEHKNGSVKCKYTRSFPPKRIAACWCLADDKSLALKIEHFLKQLSKTQKRDLIAQPQQLSHLLINAGFDPELVNSVQFYDKN